MTGCRRTLTIGFISGVTGGVFVVLLMLLLRYFMGVPTLAELILDCATPFLPIPVFFGMLHAVGGYNHLKEIGVVSTLMTIITFAGAAGMGYGLTVERAWSRNLPSLSSSSHYRAGIRFLLLVLAITWGLSIGLLWPALGANYSGRSPAKALVLNPLSLLLIFVAGGIVLVAVHRMLVGQHKEEESRGLLQNRRKILSAVLCSTGIVAVVVMLRKFFGFAAYSYDGTETIGPHLPPITPNEDFYDVTKNSVDPQPDQSLWRLEVVGSVTTPKTYRLEEIKAMPSTSQETTLECISNRVGGGLISNAHWKGVSLQQVIQAAGPKADIVQVVFHGADAYTDDISVELAMRPTTILAYEMNGEPLPMRHGFPLRMIVPGMVGEKSIKWLTQIELRDSTAKQFYEKQGWGPKFEINTTSRFDAPDFHKPLDLGMPINLRGIAFGGARGVRSVEVSTDDGATWNPAEMTYRSSALAWVQWKYQWHPEEAGVYRLVVRAIDGTGALQSGVDKPAGPEPATGYHRVTATIKSSS
jgi:DMSO/TMAO reductase YedYZ molybdopterin-dependent catalytic subunit